MLVSQPGHIEAFPSLKELEGLSLRVTHTPMQSHMRNTKMTNPQQDLVKDLRSLSHRRDHWQLFSDFCEIAAISLSNAVDLSQFKQREERYLQIVKGYSREELTIVARCLAHVTVELENDISDVLGRTFHELELHNKWAGQFFTPYEVARMMARMTIGDCNDLRDRIAQRGFVTAQEPAVGTGAMVIGLAHEMKDAGINYQEHLHVTAIDVDIKCVHAAYVQFSLLHIPAVIIHGNTLALEEWSRWYTPAHILGGWTWKLRRREEAQVSHEIHAPPAPAPEPAASESQPEMQPSSSPKQLKLF